MAQTASQRTTVLQTALHSIDDVFRPLEAVDPSHRKEPALVKKMLKGDAAWSTQKRILGWDLDTAAGTLSLPPHRIDRLYELLDLLQPPRKRVSVKQWHQLLGGLRSMAPALPGARGLFSLLQESPGRADKHRVRITKAVQHMALDFRAIADSLQARPTRLRELVPTAPAYIGASDACAVGMGGVWFSTDPTTAPIVWRQPFDLAIQHQLVFLERPLGALSISDLELAAMIAHKNVLARTAPVAERTLWMATDNRAALPWSTKGSSTLTDARAFLLRLNSLHQRMHRYVATHNHIAGKANVMADDASRLWHMSNSELLTRFHSHYPQALPWKLLTLSPATNLALIGALSKKRPAHEFLANAAIPPAPPGNCGASSAPASGSIPTTCHPTQCPSSKSSPTASGMAPSRPAVLPCDLAQWRTPFVRWGRRMPGWGPGTLS